MNIYVRWEPADCRIVISANEATLAWLATPGPTAVRLELQKVVEGMRVRRDPAPGERAPPAGILTPKLFASALQARLRREFPDEVILVTADAP